LIVDKSGLTLIDAGLKRSFRTLVGFMDSLGHSPKELKTILLTHADLDHVGAAPKLKEISGARIFTSQIEAEALAEGRSSRPLQLGALTPLTARLERLGGGMRIPVDQVLADGDLLPILGGMEVVFSPGHTPGHISYYIPQYKLLFAGDSVSTQPDSVLYNRMKIFNWDAGQMRASVQRQAAMQPAIVCSGHGPVVFRAADKFPSA